MVKLHEGKIALVTGANRGMGLEIARQLGQEGVYVLVSARTRNKAEEAAATLRAEGLQAEGIQLEVTSTEDVAAVVNHIETRFGRLDILVNNAGITPPKGASLEERMRGTFEVNTLAPYVLTEALFPLLLKSEAGRVVNQSSAIGSIGMWFSDGIVQRIGDPAYAVSKAGMNMLTAVWSQKYKDTPLKINSVHPGIVQTDMGGPKAPVSVEDGSKTAVRLALIPEDGPTGGFFYMDETLPW